jgi:hypothetical protein
MPPERLNLRSRDQFPILGGLALLCVALAGCQSPIPSPTSEPTASAAPTAAAAAECPPIDIRTPQGTRIDLTGTWVTGSRLAGDEVFYEVRQSGECLWGRAYSAFEGQEPAELFDILIVGIVRSDFTAEVDLLELRLGNPFGYPSFDRASATLALQFERTADGESLVLEIVDLRARRMVEGVPGGRLFIGTGPTEGDVLTRSP